MTWIPNLRALGELAAGPCRQACAMMHVITGSEPHRVVPFERTLCVMPINGTATGVLAAVRLRGQVPGAPARDGARVDADD